MNRVLMRDDRTMSSSWGSACWQSVPYVAMKRCLAAAKRLHAVSMLHPEQLPVWDATMPWWTLVMSPQAGRA